MKTAKLLNLFNIAIHSDYLGAKSFGHKKRDQMVPFLKYLKFCYFFFFFLAPFLPPLSFKAAKRPTTPIPA